MNQRPDALINADAWISVLKADIDGSFSKARRFTEVPSAVVSGKTSWEGNAQETRHIELNCTLRLSDDGIWLIQAKFTGNHKKGTLFEYAKYYAIADGVVMNYRSEDLKTSPLAYLQHFDYGYFYKQPATEERPLSLEIDIPHPPLAGEEVTIIYRADSPLIDIKNLVVKTTFVKRTENGGILEIPAREVVVNSELGFFEDIFGNLRWNDWQIDLKKGQSQELSTTIRFPEPGEWQISIYGKGSISETKKVTDNDDINLTIKENRAYYGWERI